MEKYLVKKVLNNNVILVENNGQDYILVGKGIGFNKKKNSIIQDTKKIEEKFMSLKGLNEDEYNNFFEKVDPKIIELTKEIIELIQKELNETFNPKVHIAFIDHINFAVKRLREGIEIVNPFLIETKILYPIEYELAQKAVEILEKNLDLNIPEAEIGFLTLHIYGGRKKGNKSKALQNSKIISKVLELTESRFQINIDKTSFICRRFIMHIAGVINRVSNNKCHKNDILSKLEDDLFYEIKVAYEISKIIQNELKTNVPKSEIGYIALHLYKIKDYY